MLLIGRLRVASWWAGGGWGECSAVQCNMLVWHNAKEAGRILAGCVDAYSTAAP
jgi:hypothetical protein